MLREVPQTGKRELVPSVNPERNGNPESRSNKLSVTRSDLGCSCGMRSAAVSQIFGRRYGARKFCGEDDE